MASFTRAAIAPKSRLPNSYSRSSTIVNPRFCMTSLAPIETKCTEGNLLATTAIVFGGRPVETSASRTEPGMVACGSGPIAWVGKYMSYV